MAIVTDLHRRITADDLLEAAKGTVKDIVIIGWDGDSEMIVASNMNDGDIMVAMEVAKSGILGAYFGVEH